MKEHDFLKILEKLQIWEALKAKNLNAKFLIGKALFLTPFKGKEMTKYTTYGNLHWMVLKLFRGVYFLCRVGRKVCPNMCCKNNNWLGIKQVMPENNFE